MFINNLILKFSASWWSHCDQENQLNGKPNFSFRLLQLTPDKQFSNFHYHFLNFCIVIKKQTKSSDNMERKNSFSLPFFMTQSPEMPRKLLWNPRPLKRFGCNCAVCMTSSWPWITTGKGFIIPGTSCVDPDWLLGAGHAFLGVSSDAAPLGTQLGSTRTHVTNDFYCINSNLLVISFWSHLNINELIAISSCTCHNSWAVVACAKIYSNIL